MNRTYGVILLCLMLLSSTAQAQQSLPNGKTIGLKASTDGSLLESNELKDGIPFNLTFTPDVKFKAGWHLLTIEYRIENLEKLDRETCLKIYGADRRITGAYELQRLENSEWNTQHLYFKSPDCADGGVSIAIQGKAVFRNGSGRLAIRKLDISEYDPETCGELVPDAFFKESREGMFPGAWSGGDGAACVLVGNASFKDGLPVLRIEKAEGQGNGTFIRSASFPLPKKDGLMMSAWAKGSGKMSLYLIRRDWSAKGGKTFPLSNEWRQYCFEFDAREQRDGETFFILAKFDDGTNFFAAPSLKPAIKDKASDGFENRYVGVPCGNLVMNPDFEMGWQGWGAAFSTPTTAEAAAANIKASMPEVRSCGGVDGGACLSLPAGRSLTSLDMPVARGREYTVSAYMKATSKTSASVAVVDRKWSGYNRKVEISTEWSRQSFTFKWDKPCYQGEAYLAFSAPGGMLIDKIQFHEGPLREYGRPPVMLGVLSKNNVLKRNEKADMELKAVPAPALHEDYSATIALKDEEGRTIMEKSYDLPADTASVRKLDPPTGRFGLYRLYMTATARDGRILGLATARYAVIPDIPQDRRMDSHLMTNIIPDVFPRSYYERTLPAWTAMGVSGFVVEHQVPYSKPYENRPFVASMKSQIGLCGRFSSDIIIRILENNDIFRKMCLVDDESSVAAWREYVRGMIDAYRGAARSFAFLGEVNIYTMTQGIIDKYKDMKLPPRGARLMPPEKTFKYFKAAAETVKATDASLAVVGPSINGEALPYIKSFMDCGAESYMDAFGMDAYRAGPDAPEVFADYLALKRILEGRKFKGPAINLEQYMGVTSQGYPGQPESDRDYYYPWNKERLYAGVLARNLIQHKAANVKWSAYFAQMQLFDPFWLDGGFPSMAGPALAATVNILGNAGRGMKLTQSDDIKAFAFPDAADGPVMAVYSALDDMNATIRMRGVEKAWDVMGNQFDEARIEAGLPLTACPIYLKFKAGSRQDELEKLYGDADIRGAGEPFDIKVSISGENKLSVALTNRTNKTLEGAVRLTKIPDAWRCAKKETTFPPLAPGGMKSVEIVFDAMPVNDMGSYPVGVSAVSGDAFACRDLTLSPIFSAKRPSLKIDGDYGKWEGANWIELSTPGNLVYAKGDAPPSFKAKIASMWDGKGLALAILTDDMDFMPPTASETLMYEFDSLQVYFGPPPNSRGERKSYAREDVVYSIGLLNGVPTAYLEQGPEGRYLGPANTVQGVDADIKLSIKHDGGRTFYEMLLPWETLKFAKPGKGESLGFSIFVHNKDKGGISGISLDKASPYKKPGVWKTLIMKE